MGRTLTERTRQRARERFLIELAQRGIVRDAALAAKMSREWCYSERQRDPAFAAAWDDALNEAIDRAEREAWRRAIEGTTKPLIGRVGKDRDGVITTITEYSDSILLRILSAHRPEKWRERYEHTGGIEVRHKGYVQVSPDDWDAHDHSTSDTPTDPPPDRAV